MARPGPKKKTAPKPPPKVGGGALKGGSSGGQASIMLDYTPRPQFIDYHNRMQRFACIVAHRRFGKALDVGTLIPMADGSLKPIGQIVDGDRVLDETGAPCDVVTAHPVMIGRPCYAVEFDDGTVIVADEDHLWLTQTKADRSHHTGVRRGPRGAAKYVSRTFAPRQGTVRTTKEIAATLRSRGETNHSIDVAGPAQYAPQDLPIDPYVLGLWLGDGHSDSFRVTTMDPEIVETLAAFAETGGFALTRIASSNTGKASTYSVAGVRGASATGMLRELGILDMKHITERYLRGSVEQRIALVQGLMDTDGSIVPTGRACEITQKNRNLAYGICRVLRSLGVKLTVATKWINSVPYWRITFSPPFNPFRLKRKADVWQPPHETHAFSTKWRIVDVRLTHSRPVRCLTVNSPSRLYLASEAFIPTHNTTGNIHELQKGALTCPLPNPRFAYIAPQLKQAKDVAWDMLKNAAAPLLKHGVSFNEAELRVDYPNGGRVRLYGADNPDSMRGIYLDGVTLDEYAQMDPAMWRDVVRPAIADREGWATFIGTPKGRDAFWKRYREALADPQNWFSLILRASETGVIPPDELAKIRKDQDDDAAYMREMECSFDVPSEMQFIPAGLIHEAVTREVKPIGPRLLGVDVARAGADSNVILLRDGDLVEQDWILKFKQADLMQTVGRVSEAIERWRPDMVFVDGGGVGGGVIDRLRQLGFMNIIEVNSASKALDPDKFKNLRAEMYWKVRAWLKDRGRIPHDERLIDDLAAPNYKYDGANRLQLEGKEEMKGRGIPSPDVSDALALTFAQAVGFGLGGKTKPKMLYYEDADPFGAYD